MTKDYYHLDIYVMHCKYFAQIFTCELVGGKQAGSLLQFAYHVFLWIGTTSAFFQSFGNILS